jgi:hypothetical protein
MDDITPPFFVVTSPEGRGDTERGLEGDPPRGRGFNYISIGVPLRYLILNMYVCINFFSYNKYRDYI